MSICCANMRTKSEASEKKGVGIEVYFTEWEYNVCEKKDTPTAFLKIRHSDTFT